MDTGPDLMYHLQRVDQDNSAKDYLASIDYIQKKRLTLSLVELIEMYGDTEVDGIPFQRMIQDIQLAHHGADMNGFSN